MGSKVQVIDSKATWESTLASAKEAGKVVIVDFYADWCPPCKIISPIFESLSAQYDSIIFLSVNVDNVEELATICDIRAMPTFQVYKDGVKADELVGASQDKLTEMLVKHSAASK